MCLRDLERYLLKYTLHEGVLLNMSTIRRDCWTEESNLALKRMTLDCNFFIFTKWDETFAHPVGNMMVFSI